MATYTVFTNTSDVDFSYNLTTISSSDYTPVISVGDLKSVAVGTTVTSIGTNAFLDCSGLTSVTFEAGSQLTSIENYAFKNATSLVTIEIPKLVTHIGHYAFYNCTSLTSISFEDGSNFPAHNCYYNHNYDYICVGFQSTVFQSSGLTTIYAPQAVITNMEWTAGSSNNSVSGGGSNILVVLVTLGPEPEPDLPPNLTVFFTASDNSGVDKTMGGVNQKTAPGLANNLNMLRNKYRGSYNRGRNTNI